MDVTDLLLCSHIIEYVATSQNIHQTFYSFLIIRNDALRMSCLQEETSIIFIHRIFIKNDPEYNFLFVENVGKKVEIVWWIGYECRLKVCL
jgi:hypothetical protein